VCCGERVPSAREYLRAADKYCHESQPPSLKITGDIILLLIHMKNNGIFRDEIRFVFTYPLWTLYCLSAFIVHNVFSWYFATGYCFICHINNIMSNFYVIIFTDRISFQIDGKQSNSYYSTIEIVILKR